MSVITTAEGVCSVCGREVALVGTSITRYHPASLTGSYVECAGSLKQPREITKTE